MAPQEAGLVGRCLGLKMVAVEEAGTAGYPWAAALGWVVFWAPARRNRGQG